jgi:hypothetical protein
MEDGGQVTFLLTNTHKRTRLTAISKRAVKYTMVR